MNEGKELSELFAAERAVRPSAELAERGLSRLAEGLAASGAVPVAAAGVKLGWVGMTKWVLSGLLLGAGGSAVTAAAFHEAPAPSRSAASAPRVRSVPASEARVVASASDPAPAAEPAPASATPSAAMVRRRPSRASASSLPGSAERETFDAELRLINSAKGELDAGRPHLAKVWLGEHAARYTNGVFSTDREALQVLAACAERREPVLARRFVAAHPTSPLSERLTRACDVTNSK